MPPSEQHGGHGILRSLNAAQTRAVTSNASTVAILAGPGSGKTHTLTARVVWLVQQTGYKPSDIIVATFTVKAAREMKERIGKILGAEPERKIVLGTFHSIARRYLSAYGKRIGLDPKFGIADDGDSRAIIQRICKRLDGKVDPAHAKGWISKKKAKGDGAGAATTAKGKKAPENPMLEVCYQEYQDHLERSNLLDYDDLLVRCVELLKKHPSCVSNVQSVLIDEYQDTNGIQYELMKLFAQARERITIVGDPDQSIYGWRSAEIKNLYRLLRDYPKTDEISLEENYRSSQSILDVSLAVIQQDEKRYKKVLLPVHTKGARPVLRSLKSSAVEGDWIVSEIRRIVLMFGGMLKYEDTAILLRSASLSRHIESALGKAGIAYRMIGGHKFYDRKEIKILLDYLRVIYQPDNNDALARIINVPRRGIGETTIKSLLEEAEKEKMSLWSLVKKHCRGERKATTKILPKQEQKLSGGLMKLISGLQQKHDQTAEEGEKHIVETIEQLISRLDFKNYLEAEYNEDHEQRWANVQELINLAGDFVRDLSKVEEETLPEIDDLEQVKDDSILGKFLANVALASDAQKDTDETEKKSMVTISTIHAAKGLEWPVVFVPSVYTGSIPHSRADDLDEERRLLYVAMTRAKALLYLSCPVYGSQGTEGKVELSQFIAPIAAKAFAKQGPTFEKNVLESVGKILGRDVPADKVVFDKLPPMFSVEDNIFPVDPNDGKSGGGEGQFSRAPKRLRNSYGGYTPDEGGGDEGMSQDRPWHKEYSTTMEQSSNFTMSSLPGFVSAGAHQTTLSLAAAAAAEAEKKIGVKQAIKSGTTRRKPDQSSLLGFVKVEPKQPSSNSASRAIGGPDHSLARYQAASAKFTARAAATAAELKSEEPTLPQPVIDPSLARHKVPSGRVLLGKPSRPLKSDDGTAPRKDYPSFSSSPVRPAQNEGKGEANKDGGDGNGDGAPDAAPNKPASSFHATTFLSAGSRGAVRKPVGLGPPPGMSRLTKPFKPLTIARPSGPQPPQPPRRR